MWSSLSWIGFARRQRPPTNLHRPGRPVKPRPGSLSGCRQRNPPVMSIVSPVIQAESSGGEEDRGRSDVLRLADAAERRLRFDLLAEVALGDPGGVHALRLHHAGVDRVDADLARAQLLGQRPRDGIDGGLRGAVDRRVRRRQRAGDRADVDDAAAGGAEVLHRLLRGEEQPEDVQVELLVEVLLGDAFERGELVDAGVVHQDVEPAERLLRLGRTGARCPPASPRWPARRRPCRPCR